MAVERLGRSAERLLLPVLLIAVLAAGLGFRLWHAFTEPFWLDEAYSAFAADHDLHFLWTVVPRYETHPPFYYSLVHVWSLAFGHTLTVRRALGLICGIVTVPVVALAARTLAHQVLTSARDRRWLIALATALAALHPLLVMMARQVRPYPVMILVYAVATLALLHLVEAARRQAPLPRGWIVAYFVCQELMLWLHSLGPLFAASMTLAVTVAVIRRDLVRADWLWLLGAQLLTGLIYLPGFLILLAEAPEWANSTWLPFNLAEVPGQIGTIYLSWNFVVELLVIAAAVAGVVLVARRSGCGRIALSLLLLAALPTVLSVAISAVATPVFLTRTLSPVAVPGLLLIAAGLSWPGWGRVAGALAVAAMLVSTGWNDYGFVRKGPIEGWYEANAWLAARIRPGDVVWAYPNEGALPFGYALGDKGMVMPLRQIPAPVPAFDVGGYFPTGARGTVSLYPNEIARLMAEPGTKRPPTIWLLRHVRELYDPKDEMLHALEADRVDVGRYDSGHIDITGLRRKDLPSGILRSP